VAHHQEPDGVHAELAGGSDVLRRDVGLGAMRGDAHHAGTGAMRVLEVVHTADAGQQKRGDLGPLHHSRNRFDPFQIGMRAESVDAARYGQPVAVGDLDGVHPTRVERLGDRHRLFDAVLMAHGMHAVAQGDVADVQIVSHDAAPAVSVE
jgi:hypothetical protein